VRRVRDDNIRSMAQNILLVLMVVDMYNIVILTPNKPGLTVPKSVGGNAHLYPIQGLW